MRQLIINADDYGYSCERDAGIIECFKQGAVTNVSVMVNGVAVAEGVKLALQEGLPMGLHLNLTEGSPVGPGPYPTLTAPTGFLRGMVGFLQNAREGKIDVEEVRAEIQCQIDRFATLVGHKPFNVDGHQHAHVVPGISQVFAEVMKKNGITKSRLPIEDEILLTSHPWTIDWFPVFMTRVVQEAKHAANVFQKYGVRAPAFTGLRTMSRDMSVARLQEDISFVYGQLETAGHASICELMVHPGNRTGRHGGCGDGPDEFSQSEDREYEKGIVCSEEMKKFYQTNGISLVSFEQADF